MALTPKARRELTALQVVIALHPNVIEMETWVGFGENRSFLSDKQNFSCGSVGCIAGLRVALDAPEGLTPAYILKLTKKHKGEGQAAIWIEAQKKLGLTSEQARRLFIPGEWPSGIKEELDRFKPVARWLDRYDDKSPDAQLVEEFDALAGSREVTEQVGVIAGQRDELDQFKYAHVVIKRIQHLLDHDGEDEYDDFDDDDYDDYDY